MPVVINGVDFDDLFKQLKKLRIDLDSLEKKIAYQQDEIAELKKKLGEGR